ncbi:MAG: hypothetical protein AABW72_06035 [archaeon]
MVNAIELLKELDVYPVFDVNIVSALTGKSTQYSKLLLNRLKNKKYLFHLGRNKYTMRTDPFVFASRIYWPSYISTWSAIRYYNISEHLPQAIDIVTARRPRKKTIKFMNSTINFVSVKPKVMFAYKKITIGGSEIFIAELEKAIADGVAFKRISMSEGIDLCRNKKVDSNKVKRYLSIIGNRSLKHKIDILF